MPPNIEPTDQVLSDVTQRLQALNQSQTSIASMTSSRSMPVACPSGSKATTRHSCDSCSKQCSSSTHLHLHRQTHLVENMAVRLKPSRATRSPESVTITDETEVLSLGSPAKGKLETLLHTGKQKIRRSKLQIAPNDDSNLSSFFAGKRSSQRSASSGDSGYESMDRPDPVADLLGMKVKEAMAKEGSGDRRPRPSPIIIKHNVTKRTRDQGADVAAQSAFFARHRSDEISKFKRFSKNLDEKSLLKPGVVMPAVVKVQNERPPAHYVAIGGSAKPAQRGISTAIAAMNSAMSSTDDVLGDLVSPTSFRSRMESSRQSGASMSEGELSFIGVNAPSLYSVQSRDPEVDTIAECLARNVIKRYINFQSQCSIRCRPASSQDSNSSHSTPLTSARHTPATSVSSTSKRSRGKDDRDQPNDDDTGRRDSSVKRSRVDGPSDIKLFACPYSKFDPSRFSELNLVEKEYRRCSCCYLRDIPRLKQHLYRVHRRPEYYCGSCFESFKARELLDAHMRQRPACELRSPKFEEKMTDEQFSAIKRRIVKGDPCELWFNIFKTLFPTAPKPLSPYASDNDAVAVNHFVALFRWFGPEELLNLLRDRRNRDRHTPDSSPLEPSTQAIVDEAFEIALPEYLSLFRGREEAAKPVVSSTSSTGTADPDPDHDHDHDHEPNPYPDSVYRHHHHDTQPRSPAPTAFFTFPATHNNHNNPLSHENDIVQQTSIYIAPTSTFTSTATSIQPITSQPSASSSSLHASSSSFAGMATEQNGGGAFNTTAPFVAATTATTASAAPMPPTGSPMWMSADTGFDAAEVFHAFESYSTVADSMMAATATASAPAATAGVVGVGVGNHNSNNANDSTAALGPLGPEIVAVDDFFDFGRY